MTGCYILHILLRLGDVKITADKCSYIAAKVSTNKLILCIYILVFCHHSLDSILTLDQFSLIQRLVRSGTTTKFFLLVILGMVSLLKFMNRDWLLYMLLGTADKSSYSSYAIEKVSSKEMILSILASDQIIPNTNTGIIVY